MLGVAETCRLSSVLDVVMPLRAGTPIDVKLLLDVERLPDAELLLDENELLDLAAVLELEMLVATLELLLLVDELDENVAVGVPSTYPCSVEKVRSWGHSLTVYLSMSAVMTVAQTIVIVGL